ncbi:acyltransferase [Blastococcus haudaquaticus]|uniref:Transferase hexapeptide (Six repeat-containing protein) n=1 Tax=Blastococcus haudaquaticus TaxID=1938745 RepID=A0A286GZV1_9ACTN|nr:acyltransferase [Blastococcus haudaquaticus]SOE01055.1 transferase hexapeptide (six repeat-containing protein) [Blastococcus haudaquaticus]
MDQSLDLPATPAAAGYTGAPVPAARDPRARLRQWVMDRATRLRGRPLDIDEGIAAGYLASVVLERGVMAARGVVRFPLRSPRPFVGRGVRLRSKRQLAMGSGVTLGHGSLVDATSRDGVRLGDGVSVGRNTRIECTGSLATLGVGLVVGPGTGLGTDNLYGCAGGVRIGADTIVGNYVSFHSEDHVFSRRDVPIRDQGVTHQGIEVGDGCWIGSRVTVLDGARIGDGCVIAAGAVVVAGEYAPYGVYGGVPARLISRRPEG